jgi:hypothetical protein
MAQGKKLSAEDLAEWTANRATLAAAVAECDQVISAHKAAVAEEAASKAAGGIEPETLKTIIKREETAGGKRHGTVAGILALREAGGKTAGSK